MKVKLCFLALIISGCTVASPDNEKPFYERSFALPVQAREWAQKADLKDLCEGTKNWRPDAIKQASLNEIYARGFDTRACYYTGLKLTP